MILLLLELALLNYFRLKDRKFEGGNWTMWCEIYLATMSSVGVMVVNDWTDREMTGRKESEKEKRKIHEQNKKYIRRSAVSTYVEKQKI